MDGWNTILSFWVSVYFQVRSIGFNECNICNILFKEADTTANNHGCFLCSAGYISSAMMRINHEIHFAWQAQYLVRLEGDGSCSAHCKWRFICDADHWWHSFWAAGTVFGEVGGWLLLLCALEMTFHMWRGSLMTFILGGRRTIWWSWRVTLAAPRIVNDLSYVRRINHEIDFAWQAQYLVKLEGDSCSYAHCKWRFKLVLE